jgi:microcystin-dependent protein
LPFWLVLDPSGKLHGTPFASGPVTPFVVRATDVLGAFGTLTVAGLQVVDPLILSVPGSCVFNLNTVYSCQLVVSGGAFGAYSFTVVSGTLPTQVTLDPASGLLASIGLPTDSGSGFVTIMVVDTQGATAQAVVNFVFPSPPSTVVMQRVDNPATGVNAPVDAIGLAGSNLPHENRMQYIATNYIISLLGIFPSKKRSGPYVGEIAQFGGNYAPKGEVSNFLL